MAGHQEVITNLSHQVKYFAKLPSVVLGRVILFSSIFPNMGCRPAGTESEQALRLPFLGCSFFEGCLLNSVVQEHV